MYHVCSNNQSQTASVHVWVYPIDRAGIRYVPTIATNTTMAIVHLVFAEKSLLKVFSQICYKKKYY